MRETGFALYLGATPEAPVDGMFSFVPCLPVEGRPVGFPRPELDNREVISPRLAMSVRLNRELEPARIPELWRWVAERVVEDGLALGTRVSMPTKDGLGIVAAREEATAR